LPENPRAIEGITRTQLKKIELLKSFISQFNEAEFLREETRLNSFAKSGTYFQSRLQGVRDREHIEIAFLNSQNNLIATKRLFEGTISEAPIFPREIIKEAFNHNAKNIIIAHNHPGGSRQPSSADLEITRKIKEALNTVQVGLIDHIIVAGNSYVSLMEQGLM